MSPFTQNQRYERIVLIMQEQVHMSSQSPDVSRYAPAPVVTRHERTFPGPWSVNQILQGYRVLDANHRVLVYVVTSDHDTGEQSGGLTLEEAGRIARVISSLPELIPDAPRGRTKWSLWKSIRGSTEQRDLR